MGKYRITRVTVMEKYRITAESVSWRNIELLLSLCHGEI